MENENKSYTSLCFLLLFEALPDNICMYITANCDCCLSN